MAIAMKNLITFFITAVFFIENAGISYALRPLATGNSSAKLKAALVLIGSSSREKPSSEALKDILVSSRPVSKKRPRERFDTAAGKHSIKHSILLGLPESHFLLDAELRLENILGGILYKGLADPKRRDRIPVKKVPTGKMKTLAMIAEEEKGRTILVDEALLSLPYTLYISLAGAVGYNLEKRFTYKAHCHSIFYQILAYMSLDKTTKEIFRNETEELKGKNKANLDEFINFADAVIRKVAYEDCNYFCSDEFIELLFSFVDVHYPYLKTKRAISKTVMAKEINRLVKNCRIGRWIMRDLIYRSNAIDFSGAESVNGEREKIVAQTDRIVKSRLLTRSDLFGALSKWGVYGGLGEQVLRRIVENNPDYFNYNCVEALAMSQAGDYNDIKMFCSGMEHLKEILHGVPKDKYMTGGKATISLETEQILNSEDAHYVASGVLEAIASIYPEKIRKRVFRWLIISLEIFLSRGGGRQFSSDDVGYYYSPPVFKALKDKAPKRYAKLLVGSGIGDKELSFLIRGYRKVEEDAIKYKYIDLDTVYEIAKLALNSKDKEAALLLLRRIVKLRPVFMIRLFGKMGASIYELFEELKGIPLENFKNLKENKERWGLSNDFVALCVGDKAVDKGILRLDALFEKESPFVCMKIVKRLFSDKDPWTIDEIVRLYDIEIFYATRSFHEVYIDNILTLSAEKRKKVFMVLKGSLTSEELYWLSPASANYIVTAVLKHAEEIMQVEDDILRQRFIGIRELIKQKNGLEPSVYIKLLLAKDEAAFNRLYAGVLLSAGVKVELQVSAGLKNKLKRFKNNFNDVEPSLERKESEGDVFYFILSLFDLCDADTLANLTKEEAHERYKAAAKIYYPDKGGTARGFSMLREAYNILLEFIAEDGKADIERLYKEPLPLEGTVPGGAVRAQNCLTAILQAA